MNLTIQRKQQRVAEPLPATRRVDLILAGATGRVGTALRKQLQQNRDELLDDLRIDLRLVTVANSRATAEAFDGFDDDVVESALRFGEKTNWTAYVDRLSDRPHRRRLFIDCTASAEVAALYGPLLRKGIGVVTPNKVALSGELREYAALRDASRAFDAPLFYETTVGAALPLVETIANLRRTGDQLVSVIAVLSGTIAFVVSELHAGRKFSEAVREAIRRGFTEPDPRIDLSGEDVARKLLILSREAGVPLERRHVDLEPLIPKHIRFDGDVDRFIAALRPLDEQFAERVAAAERGGNRLAFVATLRNGHAYVALGAIPIDHAIAKTNAQENVVIIRSLRYAATPLTISGPGAGPDITASGVLADVLRAAM